MKKIPICRQCEYMKLIGRARITGNSLPEGPRGDCMCEHPKAVETFERVLPHSPRMAAFIGFTKPGEEYPNIKTSPRWCPLREEAEAALKGGTHETNTV
ncbi:hypothetical protein [Intestinimonas massiliensis (ex Afouda et al. 2020)]|uniref:Uncharacterized protein n=1 Tax=Intestinimonas massiliensis (ex Afouda et al. 2020) TaxID=1673721 RepID=A0ABS9M7Z7_9FIRM|nr:hypothetical protein [Intestinimonas massiliensis (ex Afouda et al. 2020)]MCG4526932.1 hypothetical protein [Intestinimonas massiliensis (ex Afouda et al. 2020)]